LARGLAVLAASVACSLICAPAPATPTAALKPSPEANVVAEFDASDESWADLHRAVQETLGDVIREAEELLGSPDLSTRFAAVCGTRRTSPPPCFTRITGMPSGGAPATSGGAITTATATRSNSTRTTTTAAARMDTRT